MERIEGFEPLAEVPPKQRAKELLHKYIAGDSHEHTIFSNPSTRHEADYTFRQIYEFTKNELVDGDYESQFVIFTEHSSDAGDPQLIDGNDLLKHTNEIEQFRHEQEKKGLLLPHILSGVEANIIGSEGEVDVPDEVLAQLDLVIASGHSLKKAFPEKNGIPNAEELTNAYYNMMNNPNIDVIGHPSRCTSKETLAAMDWDKLIAKAVDTRTALEINVGAPMPKWLIIKVLEAKAPIFIGTDAHTLKQFQKLPEDVQIEDDEARLSHPLGVKYDFWKKMMRILRLLEEYNVDPDQVLTSSYKRLNNWLSEEKSERKINWQHEIK